MLLFSIRYDYNDRYMGSQLISAGMFNNGGVYITCMRQLSAHKARETDAVLYNFTVKDAGNSNIEFACNGGLDITVTLVIHLSKYKF